MNYFYYNHNSCRNSMTSILLNLETFEKSTITGSFKLLFRGRKYEELTISLKDDDMDWHQIQKSQIAGLPRTGDIIKIFIDSCYARVARTGSGYKVYLEGRILGGSKIPVVDQILRSFGSVGDLIWGNPQKAAKRWENWTEDSFLSNFGKTVGLTVASGATAIVGETKIASNLIQKAGDSGQKLGGMALSSGYQIGGIGAQVLTFGIPNPVSGACNSFSSAMNNVIDKNVKENKRGLDWDELGNQAMIGLVKGAVSSGGLIPYAGKAVQSSMRGKKIEFNHGEEWAQWGLNVGVTAVTLGTVKGVNALTQAGKIGFKTALGIGGSSGFISGLGSGYLSQMIHSSALQDKLEGEGFKFKQNRVNKQTGSYYAVYSKKGSQDVFLPCPDLGDVLGAALLQGIMTALTAGKQYQKAKPKSTKFYGVSKPQYLSQGAQSTETLGQFQIDNVPGQHSHRNQQLANELQWHAKWQNVSSQSNMAMKVLSKVHDGGIDMLFLQHAGPHQYGPFTPSNSEYFINMINKMSVKAFKNGGMKITNIGLLGCQVSLDWKNFLKAKTGINILTLPNHPNSILEINDLNQFKYYTNNTTICQGPLHTIVQHMT